MHAVPTCATEYWPAVQFVHTTSAVVVQPAALRRVPAAQVLQAVHAVAPAADQLTPAVQLAHTTSAAAEQLEAR